MLFSTTTKKIIPLSFIQFLKFIIFQCLLVELFGLQFSTQTVKRIQLEFRLLVVDVIRWRIFFLLLNPSLKKVFEHQLHLKLPHNQTNISSQPCCNINIKAENNRRRIEPVVNRFFFSSSKKKTIRTHKTTEKLKQKLNNVYSTYRMSKAFFSSSSGKHIYEPQKCMLSSWAIREMYL